MNKNPSLKHEFETNGYVVLESLLSPDEVTAAREAIQHCVAYTAAHPGKRQGGNGSPVVLHSATSDFIFQLEPGVDPDEVPSETLEFKVRKLMNFDREHPAFSSIAHGHPRLGPALEALLGPDPVLFQSMALIKPPHIGSEKPWHQDNAYFNVNHYHAATAVRLPTEEYDRIYAEADGTPASCEAARQQGI